MRSVLLAVAAALCLVLAACAGTGSPSTPSGLVAGCSDYVKTGTPLYADISGADVKSGCSRGHDRDGHQVTMFIAFGELDPTLAHSVPEIQSNDFAPKFAMTMFRFDENVTPTANKERGYMARMLPGKIPVEIGGHHVNADVGRTDDEATGITFGCLLAVVPGKTGTPTKVVLCRSIGLVSGDDLVMEKAKAIAIHDLPAINP